MQLITNGVNAEESGSQVPDTSLKKSICWTFGMDRFLAELLVEQTHLRRRSDNGFLKVAWTTVEAKMNSRFKSNITRNHCKNRLRTWNKQYQIVKSLLNHGGFRWDDASSMVVADENVWEDYIKVHPDAKQFRRKSLPNYNELCIIIGENQIGGIGGNKARTSNKVETDDNTPRSNDVTPLMADNLEPRVDHMNDSDSDEDLEHSSPRSGHLSMMSTVPKRLGKRKKGATASILDSLAQMTDAVKLIASERNGIAKEFSMEKKLKTLYEEIRKVPNIDRNIRVQALDFFSDNENKANMFLILDEDDRYEWLKLRFGC
ncbi:L10-interacting MYB domain-containing protein-like [Tasmannia lanceolata]|uniref:L10-interacting MYB domain-containing protein-like n=1 Tax=Tasmannia lanceolata TaxID=3420 RepID=UPI0040636A3E